MSKHWKTKKLNFKKMEQLRADIAPAKKEMVEVINKTEEIEPAVIELKEYKNRFVNVQAHRLSENSTVHCADGKKLIGNAGDYYVQLDKVQEFILPEEIFRKLFLFKTEN